VPDTAAGLRNIPAAHMRAVDAGFQESGNMGAVKTLLGHQYEQLKVCVYWMRRHHYFLGLRKWLSVHSTCFLCFGCGTDVIGNGFHGRQVMGPAVSAC
jgi:hypothetical protein